MKTITVILTLMSTISVVQSQESAPFPPAPSGVSAVTTVAADNEPGTRIVITGSVFQSDRKTPYTGLVLYFYQTDATGVYNKTDGSYLKPRLYGWVKTDAEGRYEIRTIKPGSYPRRKEAAHIHVTVRRSGPSPRWLDSFLFEGDPNLNEEERMQPQKLGRLSPVVRLTKVKDGVLRAERDFVIPEG
ncbi:MAG TPA: intradiol ring-cleavage dioxygenase [Bacteroidota bacterium]